MNSTQKDDKMQENWNDATNEILLKLKEESDYDIPQTDATCGYKSSSLLSTTVIRESVGGSIQNRQRKTAFCKNTNFGIHQQEECSPDAKKERLECNAHSDATCCSQFPSMSPPSVQEFMDADLPDGGRKGETSTCKKSDIRFNKKEHSLVDDKQIDDSTLEVYIKEEDHDHEQSMNWVEIKEESLKDDALSYASFDPLSTCKKNIEVIQKEGSIVDDKQTDSRIPEGIFLKKEDCDLSETCLENNKESPEDDDHSDASGSQSPSPTTLLVQESMATNISKYQRRKMPCEVCNKRFTSWNLKAHMRIHTKEKPFLCDICKKSFSQSSHLKTHMRTHTKEKPHTCEICNKAFSEKFPLVNHMRIHTKEKPFTCDICNKAFSQRGSLLEHKRVHTKEKRFSCDICNKTFTQKTTLRGHMEMHLEEKALVCDICNKTFALRSTLVRHKRMHKTERTFTCDICNKSFFQKGALKEHVQSHTKPFKCDICNKGFSRRNIYMRHSRVHT